MTGNQYPNTEQGIPRSRKNPTNMNPFFTILHYLLFLIAIILWTGLLLFFLSQYIRFNFISMFIACTIAIATISCIPHVKTRITEFLSHPFPVSPAIILALLFVVAKPAFVWVFEYRGFGNGVMLTRTTPASDVLLTFDDGPSADWTGEVIQVLKKNQVTGIFFVVGAAGEAHPDYIRLLREAEQEIGVHSYAHRPLPFLFTRQIEEEIDRTISAIRAAGGGHPRFFRPPWGLYNREVLEIVRSRNLKTILWSRSTGDWRAKSPQDIVSNAVSNLKPGEIILLHDGHKPGLTREPTVRALPEIIADIRKKGYEVSGPPGIFYHAEAPEKER